MKRWEYMKIAISSLFYIAILLLISTILYPRFFPHIASSLKKFMESCDVKLKSLFKRELKNEYETDIEGQVRDKAVELLLDLGLDDDPDSHPPYYDNIISLN